MKITVYQVGKTKKKYFAEAEEEYVKRLAPFADMRIVTIKECTRGGVKNPAGIEEIKKKEADEILKRLSGDGAGKREDLNLLVALDGRGVQMDSVEFAEYMQKKRDIGARLNFVIGGCYGLHSSLIDRADLRLSFSKFTFTHEMIRQMLFEQIYRAFTIISGKQYHY